MHRFGRTLAACLAAGSLLGPAIAGAEEHASDVPAAKAPDDTGTNVRDRGGMLPTPTDQSNDPADVAITREIRAGITADDSLGTNARNVKVITMNRAVTLRGPVADAREKAAIEAIARRAPGVAQVDNQIEVAGEAPAAAEEKE
jgi:osmotically-inducible protein OsmY